MALIRDVGENKFKYILTASVPYQLPFMLGTLEYHFASYSQNSGNIALGGQ